MEYFIKTSGINVGKKNLECQNFLRENEKILNDVINNKYPILQPMFKVNNKKDFLTKIKEKFKNEYIKKYSKKIINQSIKTLSIDYQMFFFKYACFCDPNIILTITLDKKIKNKKFIFEIDINDKILLHLNLQIHFLRDTFDDFKDYVFSILEELGKHSYKRISEMDSNKNRKLYIYLDYDKMEGKDIIFQSNCFYELVEGAKIFLNNNNYKFMNEWSNTIYMYNLDETYKTFFYMRFLKFYWHFNYSLYIQENNILLGSYLLFCLGLRCPRDIDIYSLLPIKSIPCNYDIKTVPVDDINYNFWQNIIVNPSNHNCIFGFKANILEIEIFRRKERYNTTNSRKTMTDLVVLSYLTNKKIDTQQDIKKMLQFRYPKLIKILYSLKI